MKKIGLCVSFQGTNYGMLLQCFATQEILGKLGYETEIIKYKSGFFKGVKPSFAAFHVGISVIKRKFHSSKTKKRLVDDLHQKNIDERILVSRKFRDERLKNVVTVTGIHQLREKSKEYHAVLAGSDQLWLPDATVGNFYTLRFAADGVLRISYATSLGVSEYPSYARKPAKDFLKKMDYISVRESEGKNIINGICDVSVEVVCDPTYLFTSEEWKNFIPYKNLHKEKYVLSYMLGNDENQKRFIRKFADMNNLKVVSILSNESNSDDSSYADEILTGQTVEEFINLIRNSEFVMTDSFHGMAFTIMNHKQFYAFYRVRDDSKFSRNSRIDNILRLWGIQDRLVSEPQNMEYTDKRVDYYAVEEKIDRLREKSLEFLKSALRGEKYDYE